MLRAFARLSTSLKILIVLSLALLPLGIIASLASIETAKANRTNREAAARLLANDSAERFNLYIDHVAGLLHAAQRNGPAGCRRAITALDAPGAAVAIFNAGGKLICSSRPLVATSPMLAAGPAPIATIDGEDQAVRLIASAGDVPGWAFAVLPKALLARSLHPNALDGSYALRLDDQSGQTLSLATIESVPLGRSVLASFPIAGGQLRLTMTIATPPLSANEILLTLLPLLMWISAAAIGWLVVDRLILRPLDAMQEAVDRYRLTGHFETPPLTTPALEIRTLGHAFQRAALTITRHEAELEEGLARQTKLTREVHHRVKNNLQVVASLLNIHARGARTPEAADAYATIQRRVDALALVHRSHYAELEVNQGIALRPLIGELAANLRRSLPGKIKPPVISLAVGLFHVQQDAAISAAFLLVELVETAMTRLPGTTIAITLEAVRGRGDRALLTVRSPALARDAAPVDDRFELFERVVGGLARQIRAPLERDEVRGTATIELTVLDEATRAGAA
ncbi:sensor histidine kinase [uncultured Sphingomonas sp.]|uniref:sensor histidine kinase n=1 Tax=uncultured Sphingomonas sp. TaxID=158754 RepID=UPI002627ACED|nr:sensor histidine kinase [uncultured Sphingomonas sp.]